MQNNDFQKRYIKLLKQGFLNGRRIAKDTGIDFAGNLDKLKNWRILTDTQIIIIRNTLFYYRYDILRFLNKHDIVVDLTIDELFYYVPLFPYTFKKCNIVKRKNINGGKLYISENKLPLFKEQLKKIADELNKFLEGK